MELYESNMQSEIIRSRKRARTSEFVDINESLHKWYLLAVSRNIYPGGAQLCEKAKQIAEHLGFPDFKASNGWLDRWKRRYNVKRMKINGESGDVRGETVESWKESLPELLQSFSKENIWNIDETACFWRALPDYGFGKRGSQCKGGKKAKQRVTIALLANAEGEKEAPVVIWKSESPRCFKGVDKTKLPVQYFSQSKGWMTGEILDRVLSKFNRKLRSKNRSIALLMDNAGCHPPELKEKYSNIKIIFLPPNTTSKLQPLDLGIIQNFKVHYRKLFLRFVISKIDECDSASEVIKSVDILQAIRWVSQAWEEVKQETISKCFRKAGVLRESLALVSREHEDQDPFDELDCPQPSQDDLGDLIRQLDMPATCSIGEYVNGEDDLPTCSELNDDHLWEDDFFASLDPDQSVLEEDESEQDEPDDTSFDFEPPPLKIKNFGEAIQSLEDVRIFLDSKGHSDQATTIASAVDLVASLHCKSLASARQSTLNEYL